MDGAQTPGDCQKSVCQSGEIVATADDTDAPFDSAGDCQAPACAGGTPSSMADDNDKPSDTECLIAGCSGGNPTMANAPTGTSCMNNTRACNMQGQCASCLSEAEMATCIACPVKLCGGESCPMATSCQSGFCADGVCCNEACTGECKGCNVPGMVGQCSNIPYYENDPSYTDPMSMVPGVSCDINTGSV
ncbi:MAG TPA: hypothetical protein PK156_42020, partial [Polyangium sp.]|nr:hypothetical protein [Polyangium sp.]